MRLARLRASSARFVLPLGVFLSLPYLAHAASPAPDAPPDTLQQALAEAYANNATLAEQRAALREADENVPSAISGWRPTIQLQGTVGRSSEVVTEL